MLASLAIFLIAMGGLGGSFQPTRIIIIISGLFFGLRAKMHRNLIGLSPLVRKGLLVYFVWMVYGSLTLLWAPDPEVGLNSEIIVMAIGMSSLLFFPFYYTNDPETIKKISRAWAWSCIVTLPIAVYEIFTYQHFFYFDEDRVLGGLGFNAPFAATFFGNYNGYSGILCFYYPFLLISFLQEKRKIYKAIFAIGILISVLVILINTSRGALLTFAVISFCAVKINAKRIISFAAGVVVVYFLLPGSIKASINTVISYRFGKGAALRDSSRSGLFDAGIEFTQRSYGFGIGAGGFEIEMLKSGYYEGMVNPHNIFMEVLSQYGIFVFLLFCYWLILITVKVWKNTVIDKPIKRILIGTMFCIPVIGVINSAALGYTYWWVFFTSVALIASITNSKQNIKKIENINAL